MIEKVFKYGSRQRLVYCGVKVIEHLQKLGKDRWQPTQIGESYGMNIMRYITPAGHLLVHLHPQFRWFPAYEGSALFLDFKNIKYRHLRDRDTHLLTDRQANDADLEKDEYLTECGVEITQDKVHAWVDNWDVVTPGA